MLRARVTHARIALTVALAVLTLAPALAVVHSAGGGFRGSTAAPIVPTFVRPSSGHAPHELIAAHLLGSTTLGGATPLAPYTGVGSAPPSGPEFGRTAPSGASVVHTPGVRGAAGIGGSGGAVSGLGLNAFQSGQANFIPKFGPLDVEPPDQGLCVGNGFVLDTVNLAVRAYDSTTFAPVSGVATLAGLVGLPVGQQFGVAKVGGGYILSDPRCVYDAGTGHWFVSFLYLGGKGVFSKGGPFPFGPNVYGGEFLLVSTGSTPTGSYRIYFLDVTSDSLATNCPCFGDQPLLGADANVIALSTNEFPVFANGFNGAQMYLIDKAAAAAGASTVNVVHFNIGLGVNPPDDGGIGCAASGGAFCFYSVNPALSPTTGSFDASNGGTLWSVGSLDFFGSGDNRLAVFSFAGTSSIGSASPSITMTLNLVGGLETYASLGQLLPQQNGPIPLGADVYSNTGSGGGGCVGACTVGPLASNGDGNSNTVSYADHAVWVAISTVLSSGGTTTMGVAFFVLNASGTSLSVATQGYIAAKGAFLDFPTIAATPSGNALVAFTLTGPSNFPSSAFALIAINATGPLMNKVFVATAGQSPQDGFSEYQDIQNSQFRPRWGDYTFSIWAGGKVYFATEYIQAPNCSNAAFLQDPTCGQTRDEFANWGTSLNAEALT